jgi:hypothetical protein
LRNPEVEVAMSQSEESSRVAALLAGYLIASGRVAWPGTDGLVVEELVMTEYLPAAAAGRVPDAAELQARHPHLAGAVAAFFRWSGSTATSSGRD